MNRPDPPDTFRPVRRDWPVRVAPPPSPHPGNPGDPGRSGSHQAAPVRFGGA